MGKKVHSAIKPLKKEKKPKRERPNTNPKGPANFPIPTGHPKPFVKSPQHAKWPSMFKRHLGMIEAHIRTLDRVMTSMHANMQEMSQEEREAWERGEKGMWGTISAMMNRAKSCLVDARMAGVGILPSRALKEKKSLGTFGSSGTNNQPLGAKVKEEESDSSSSDSDDSSEASSSDSENEEQTVKTPQPKREPEVKTDPKPRSEAIFTPLVVGKKRKVAIEAMPTEVDESGDTVMSDEGEGDNPYFVVDPEPTPVNFTPEESATKRPRKEVREESRRVQKEAQKVKKEAKLARKRAKEEEDEQPHGAKKINVEVKVEVDELDLEEEAVDFRKIQEELEREVEAGMKAAAEKAAAKATKAEQKEKKRKRISDGTSSLEIVVKKPKKEKSEVEKTEKKEKKRKAEDLEDGEKTRKRKHKSDVEVDA